MTRYSYPTMQCDGISTVNARAFVQKKCLFTFNNKHVYMYLMHLYLESGYDRAPCIVFR